MSNEPEISHILGVDYGRAKIGLAMADSETRMAFVYGTIENNKGLFRKLAEIIEKEGVTKVIVGVPGFRNQGDEARLDSTRRLIESKRGNQEIYRGFGETLRKNLPGVEIVFVDEMFTTKMAQDNLKETGMKNIQRSDDKEAARIILQSWLDSK
ncbi:MAG: RuvX/YqgF family protein [Parcubacteria group bacterium]|jgi:putative Holliday junction resolvase